jgi:hypothetical protein
MRGPRTSHLRDIKAGSTSGVTQIQWHVPQAGCPTNGMPYKRDALQTGCPTICVAVDADPEEYVYNFIEYLFSPL